MVASHALIIRAERLQCGSMVQMIGVSAPTVCRSRVSQWPSRSRYSSPSPMLAPWGLARIPSNCPASASLLNMSSIKESQVSEVMAPEGGVRAKNIGTGSMPASSSPLRNPFTSPSSLAHISYISWPLTSWSRWNISSVVGVLINPFDSWMREMMPTLVMPEFRARPRRGHP